MKKIYVLLFAVFSVWQVNAQVLNQNAGWPNPAWTVTGTYSSAAGAFESNPTTTDSFAWDDDDAGNPSDDSIAAESPVIDLTAAVTAGQSKVRVSVPYGYRFLTGDQLRFEYWDAGASAWVAWGANIPGNNTTVTDNWCTIPKTTYTTTDLDVSAFTPTQLSGFRYRISYDDNPAGAAWNWGFCFNSPTIISVPTPCLTGFLYPDAPITPTACDGITPTEIANDSYAGDYFYVAVTSGQTYKFSSSVATDYFTLSTDDGVTAAAGGVQPLTWVSTFTGNLRVHLNLNISCGEEEVERTTSVLCGTVCLTGDLYPLDTYTPETCDGTTVNVVVANTWAGEYANINVFDANEYTFSSEVATDYITVANAAGTVALAAGTGSVNFSPTADGVVRVYFHTDSACGTQNQARERRIVCSSSIPAPDCASNPTPADGAVDVPAFDNIGLFWDAVAGATEYDIYIGDSATTLQYAGTVDTNEIPDAGAVGAYSFTIFWQVVPRNAAGAATGCAVWSFTTEAQPTDTPDYVGLQFPAAATINQGETVNVYGQVYEAGLTDVVPNIDGQADGIVAWVGVSTDDTDPADWNEAQWEAATWNSGHVSNNDEYQAAIGTGLTPGTYYYAVRFQLNGGPFVYGGINTATDPDSGNFWDGTTYLNGVLTVNAAPAPANDECGGAIALIPGGVFATNQITGTNIGATSDALIPSCQGAVHNNVWYSVVVPASGNVTIETQTTGSGYNDSVIVAYSGTCGALTSVGCDDDGGPAGVNTLMSILSLTGQTPGATLYISVFKYNGGAGVDGTFNISAYDASLGNDSFDNANFTYYPNPVKNTLNLSYTKEISNVEVFNLLGQKVFSNSINANEAQIDMSRLAKGAYMVKVTSDNQTKTVKVIKE